jgi:hypothetical protein
MHTILVPLAVGVWPKQSCAKTPQRHGVRRRCLVIVLLHWAARVVVERERGLVRRFARSGRHSRADFIQTSTSIGELPAYD